MIFVDISARIVYYSFCRQTTMREWLSGGAPPCQGGGRGFDPRLALLFLRRRQAKVPDSCLHEMKALWRPPDIEHEMRDGGGDAGRVVWRLAACYPLFYVTGMEPARGLALHGRHWRPAPCSAPVGAKRVPLARRGLRSAPVGAKRVPLARSTVSRFFFCVFTGLSHFAAAIFVQFGIH